MAIENLQAACGKCNRRKGAGVFQPQRSLQTPVGKIPPLVGHFTASED